MKPALHVCGALLTLLVAASSGIQAPAQNTPVKAPYDNPPEVAALDAMLPTLVPPETGAALTTDELVQVSRLLSSPCDQLRWLLARAQALSEQRDATELAKAAAARAQALAPLKLTGECAEVPAALQEILRRQQSLISVTDPDGLIERLKSKEAERLTDQPPWAKFVLLARGVTATKLLTRGETWDRPRIVMDGLDGLAGKIELPPTSQLLDAYTRLGEAYQSWTAADAAQLGDAAQQQSVKATFQIAAALLDRALGLDDTDLKGHTRPVPYSSSPEDWTRRAEALESAALWRWATLAHILAASPVSGQAAAPQTVARAQQLWSSFRKVSPTGWIAVDDSAGGWLPRLNAPDRLVQPKMLPLARDFNAAAREQRAAHEREILRLVEAPTAGDEAGRNKAADELFAAIESAKAADLGAPIKPLTLAELQTQLGDLQPVYLFVELAELRGGDGGTSRVCGVAVYRQYYLKPQQIKKAEDRYLSRALPFKPSADEVIKDALANGPPPTEGGAIRKDARIIIAPDGPPARGWFDFETKSLLQPMAGTGADPSWIVYVPSATALTSGSWSLDATLRVWYRAAVRMGGEVPIVSSPPRPLAARNAGPPLDREDMVLYLVALGAPYEGTENKLADLLSVKRAKPVPALPLWVKK